MKTNPYIEFLIEESRWFDEFGEKVIQPMLAEMAKKVDEAWGMPCCRTTVSTEKLRQSLKKAEAAMKRAPQKAQRGRKKR